ncbi:MAG: alcohol dehydrogenase catalytic domain-containing protein [Anaerolineae bacterium]|nr:alcohol dehydrogenase catalytic domain-containing protein [Anaerolineae bacterium]
MTDKLDLYRSGTAPLPDNYELWPLYGAGLENLGKDGQPIEVTMPAYGSDELLIRHDACGLCFSDIKVINQGQSHPRIFRDMQKEPVVLGHEVAMTIVGVGQDLREHYQVGDRLTLETDIMIRGKKLAYGYWFQGGLSQYSVIGPDIYASDLGNNLIKVRPDRGYAEIALTEPWACVVAAYALQYRTELKQGGITWIIGAGDDRPYTISAGFDAGSHPARLLLTDVPEAFASWLRARAAELGIEVTDVPSIAACPVDFADDIVLLGANADLIEQASPHLGQFGVMAILAEVSMERPVNVDIGRIHYHRWVYVGTTKADIAAAYRDLPVRSNLKPGGRAWFVGAGGPMGRMHVQRAIEFNNPPAVIVCTDVSDMRLGELNETFADQAREHGIEFVCLNPTDRAGYTAGMTTFEETGFDDIVVLAPVPSVIAEAGSHLASQGVMNVFAGVARGTLAALDLSSAYLSGTRVIGHSASLMSDFELVLDKTNSGELSPNRSVAAVGSLSAARDGLKAVKEAALAGKVVIYPHIKELPLTTLADLKERLPTVYARLNARGEWTNETEEEFLRQMLP